jgi:hypothetical protein
MALHGEDRVLTMPEAQTEGASRVATTSALVAATVGTGGADGATYSF